MKRWMFSLKDPRDHLSAISSHYIGGHWSPVSSHSRLVGGWAQTGDHSLTGLVHPPSVAPRSYNASSMLELWNVTAILQSLSMMEGFGKVVIFHMASAPLFQLVINMEAQGLGIPWLTFENQGMGTSPLLRHLMLFLLCCLLSLVLKTGSWDHYISKSYGNFTQIFLYRSPSLIVKAVTQNI